MHGYLLSSACLELLIYKFIICDRFKTWFRISVRNIILICTQTIYENYVKTPQVYQTKTTSYSQLTSKKNRSNQMVRNEQITITFYKTAALNENINLATLYIIRSGRGQVEYPTVIHLQN